MIFYILLCLCLSHESFCQSTPKDSLLLFLKSLPTYDRTIDIKKYRKDLVESINNYKGGRIPHFLNDECFYHAGKYYESIHTSECLRCSIIDSVTNINALQLLYTSKNKNLDKTCTSKEYYRVPDDNESMRSLIKKRLDALNEKDWEG